MTSNNSLCIIRLSQCSRRAWARCSGVVFGMCYKVALLISRCVQPFSSSHAFASFFLIKALTDVTQKPLGSTFSTPTQPCNLCQAGVPVWEIKYTFILVLVNANDFAELFIVCFGGWLAGGEVKCNTTNYYDFLIIVVSKIARFFWQHLHPMIQ